MKIAWFKKVISPEVGAYLAGYSMNDVSQELHDDLYADGLCIDDGERKVLLISLDLLGVDEWFIRKVRKECADILGVPESAVMLSCTHTKPFAGKKIALSVHLEAKTAYLCKVLAAGGAEMYITGSNPLSTQDDVAAALVKAGLEVHAWHGTTPE